ncbi:MAG TPA: small multi-drug export protein, partial [Candidatus Cloacimonadota bacterium]|nr:small multi-drug export protein [Candidatus Cloacimonadota bacterium]
MNLHFDFHVKPVLLIVSGLFLSSSLHASSFADSTVVWLSNHGFSPVLIVLIISMLPVIELRGSIPVAIMLFKMPWYEAVLLSVAGNMIPIPLILLFIDAFFSLLNRIPIGARFTQWLFARTRRKGKAIERYEAIGLVTFVGIPLPGT